MSQNNIFGQVLQTLAPQQNLRDYQHASRTFINSLYRLSPKLTNLFHVFIDINTALSDQSKIDALRQTEIGLMANEVQLPKMSITTKAHNAYNRKILQQEKVVYDPVTLSFHDDSADVVLNFWRDYFAYYYRDTDYLDISAYQENTKYNPRTKQMWGYSPRQDRNNEPYVSSIRIYSLHQKRFSSYTLVRPLITNFQHGSLRTTETQPLAHQMTVNYETILYDSGPVSNGTVLGFAGEHYDHTPSSLRNSGALIGAASSVLQNIENGDLISAVQNVVAGVNILNGSNYQFKQSASLDLSQIGNSILLGQNRFSPVFAPTAATVQQGLSTAKLP